jgi:hypothetical protein
MIPFIFLTVFPRKVIQDSTHWNLGLQSWFIIRPFPDPSCLKRDWGSTGDKQTSKGLFYYVASLNPSGGRTLRDYFISELFSGFEETVER